MGLHLKVEIKRDVNLPNGRLKSIAFARFFAGHCGGASVPASRGVFVALAIADPWHRLAGTLAHQPTLDVPDTASQFRAFAASKWVSNLRQIRSARFFWGNFL